jgi:hypothetical protein
MSLPGMTWRHSAIRLYAKNVGPPVKPAATAKSWMNFSGTHSMTTDQDAE